MSKWIRRIGFGIIGLLVVGGVLFFTLAADFAASRMNAVIELDLPPVSDEARALHDRLIVADLHADSLLWPRDLLKPGDYGHVDLPRLQAGNVTLQVFTTVTKSPSGLNYETNEATSDNITLLAIGSLWPPATWGNLTERALYQSRKLARFAEQSRGDLVIVRTGADLARLMAVRAAGGRQVGGILGMEGAHALEGDLANLDRLFAAGHRMIGLVHFFDNALGGSRHGLSQAGLSPFGRDVVRAAEARGMIIDLAHASEAMVRDVLEIATKPVIVSHTGVRGVCDNNRNLSDAEIDGVAAGGGLIGIGFWKTAACDVTPEAIVRSIAYVRDRVGVDHVALGSDYDGAVHVAVDAGKLAQITGALMTAGFTGDEIARVMGGNVIDLFVRLLPPG